MEISSNNQNATTFRLGKRLAKIASLVPDCSCVADIGTDHAYIPVFLVKNGVAKTAIASDIRKGPLERAQKTVSSNCCESSISARLGAGLETVSESEADVIIISGMGGILISEILKAGEKAARGASLLILQPMTATTELRLFLIKNGYSIKSESLVFEEGKLYNIITAAAQPVSGSYSPAELYLGRRESYKEEDAELYQKYCQNVIRKLNKRICGLEKSQNAQNKPELENLKELLKQIEETVGSQFPKTD